MKNLYLHIGTHKTGSTSLQRFLQEHLQLLTDQSYAFYQGTHIPENHIELYLAAMRSERDSFAKQSQGETVSGENYFDEIKLRIKSFFNEYNGFNAIFSTEGLSLLRYPDEICRLKEILGTHSKKIKIILYLRNRKDFLESYRKQLRKVPGRVPSKEYSSALYVEDDTWLIDYDQLIEVYAASFGREAISVIDYDEQMRTRGNIIPSFIEQLNILLPKDTEIALNTYNLNRTLDHRPFRD